MHARIEQLLAIEDQSVCDAAVRQHVDTCADCSGEQKRLRGVRKSLKSLPQFKTPSLDLRALQASVIPQSRVASNGWRATAVAALCALAVVSLTTFTSPVPTPTANVNAQPVLQVPAEVVAAATKQPTMATLVSYSQLLDRTLHEMPRRPTTERAATSATIDSLQEHIQWVDFQLSVARDVGLSPTQSAQLWEDRVRLMNSLLAVRYAEAQRFAML